MGEIEKKDKKKHEKEKEKQIEKEISKIQNRHNNEMQALESIDEQGVICPNPITPTIFPLESVCFQGFLFLSTVKNKPLFTQMCIKGA